jgi:TonB family protein
MKTQKHLLFPVLFLLPVFTIFMMVCSSCGEETNTTASKVMDVTVPVPPDAPPPPPPPPYIVKDGDTVWIQPEQMPAFQGGDAALLDFVAKNTVYPAAAKNNGIQGKVLVSFIIGKDGHVSDVKLEKAVNSDLDAEAMRVVSSLPAFEKAGTKNGKPVPVLLMLPISFMLK